MNQGPKRYIMMSKEIILSVKKEVETIMGSISINVVINHSTKNRKQSNATSEISWSQLGQMSLSISMWSPICLVRF